MSREERVPAPRATVAGVAGTLCLAAVSAMTAVSMCRVFSDWDYLAPMLVMVALLNHLLVMLVMVVLLNHLLVMLVMVALLNHQ